MNRRSFFSVLAAAPIAAPAIVKAVSERALASGGILADLAPGVVGECVMGEAILPLSRANGRNLFALTRPVKIKYDVERERWINLPEIKFGNSDHLSVEDQMRADDIFDAA